jgi:hypothetical protein
MVHLVPCPACERHVRVSETRCPFCGEGLDLANSPLPVLPTRRLGRAATFAFSATLVAAACGGKSDRDDQLGNVGGTVSTGGGGGTTPGDTGGTGTIYGAPGVGGVGTGGIGGGPGTGGAGAQGPGGMGNAGVGAAGGSAVGGASQGGASQGGAAGVLSNGGVAGDDDAAGAAGEAGEGGIVPPYGVPAYGVPPVPPA